METIDSSHREFVGSLAKGLSVLAAFGRATPQMTLSRVAAATELTRAAARRHLLTLEALGYVASDGRSFSLTPKVLELGAVFMSTRGWVEVAAPLLDELRHRLGESVTATVLDGADVVYVSRFPADRVLSISAEIGTRRPAFCTAMGRVLLAALPPDVLRRRLEAAPLHAFTPATLTDADGLMAEIARVRDAGHCVIDQELEPGLVAVAVPLRSAGGAVLAAIAICGHVGYGSAAALAEKCLAPLQEAAARIAGRLL